MEARAISDFVLSAGGLQLLTVVVVDVIAPIIKSLKNRHLQGHFPAERVVYFYYPFVSIACSISANILIGFVLWMLKLPKFLPKTTYKLFCDSISLLVFIDIQFFNSLFDPVLRFGCT